MESQNKNPMVSFTLKYICAWIIVVVLLNAVLGCSSKKKALEQTKTEIKTESSVDSSGTTKTKSELQQEAKTTAKQVEKSKEVEYEGAQGDSLTVTEKDGKGNVLRETTYKGRGKLKTKDSEKTADNSSSETKASKTESEVKADVKKKDSSNKKEAAKKLAVQKKGIDFMFWVWLSLAVILAIAVLYLNNRFKWLERVTTFFKK